MLRKLAVLILVIGVSAPLLANICATDPVPAASLLFPFVVIEYQPGPSMLSNPPVSVIDTSILITNTSSLTQIVHVTVWTDYGEAILQFNLLLTGYDSHRFSMRDIFVWGQLPQTVKTYHANWEGASDRGPVSSSSVNNGSWLYGVMPIPESTEDLGSRCSLADIGYPQVDPIPPSQLALLQAYLQASQTSYRGHSASCSKPFLDSYNVGDFLEQRDDHYPVWMYVTADVVESCNILFPSDMYYWTDGGQGGEARYDNVLVGEVSWFFPPFVHASGQAVHLEADEDLAVAVPMNNAGYPNSFYSRYANANDMTSDFREPLPNAWALHYDDYSGGLQSEVVAFKASTDDPVLADLETACTGPPCELIFSDCLPYTYYAWDMEENVVSTTPRKQWLNPNLMGLATQKIPVSEFYTVDTSGWILFVFPPSNYGSLTGAPEAPDNYQTWMGSFSWLGPSAGFVPGAVMANANCFPDQNLPDLGVDYDYIPTPVLAGAAEDSGGEQ